MSTRQRFTMLLFGLAVSLPLTPQVPTTTTRRIYAQINLLPATNAGVGVPVDFSVPPGDWRVVSVMAFASVGGVVTPDVETIITSNPEFRLRATESGTPETLISGGTLRGDGHKKRPMGAVYVLVIATLQQR